MVIRTLFPVLITCVLTALPVSPTLADRTIRVTYEDLDLNSAADVSELYKRIGRAANKYCKSTRVSTGTRISPEFNRCVEDAIATTVKKLDRPELSAFHASRDVGDAVDNS